MSNRLFTAMFGALVTIAVAAVAAQNPPAGKQAPAQKAGRAAAAAAPTSSSCGPNPPATLKNVKKDSRCFELRTYVVKPEGPGNIDLLHARFREHTDELFKKHGFSVIGYWQPVSKPDTLIYLLAFKDAATRDADWAAFQADPDWVKVRTDMNVALTVTNEFMIATDYSPMK
jgi:hypothetical protein